MSKNLLKEKFINEIDKDLLIKLYEKDSIAGIALQLNVPVKWVNSAFKRFNIPIRDRSATAKMSADKVKATVKEKYGYSCVFQRPDIVEKTQTPEVKQKRVDSIKKSNMENYGVESTNSLPEVKAKISKTYHDKSDSEKQSIKDKRKATNLTKYDVENYTQTDEFKDYYKANSYNFKLKEIETKRKNKSFNNSIPEKMFWLYLVDKYGEDNVIPQYKEERYPFFCDFYIPSEDLFIELNFFFTHGGHPFDPNSIEDQNKVKYIKSKMLEGSKMYRQYLYVWTILDPKKQKIAKENNLNYICLYDYDKDNLKNNYFYKEVI